MFGLVTQLASAVACFDDDFEACCPPRVADCPSPGNPRHQSPYAPVLDDWLTTDLGKVQDWVCAMSDFYILHTRFIHDRIHEFDGEDMMLLPYEILCWLRLREWAGVANPETFDHPLMQQPLAQLPEPVPLDVPATPQLDQVIDRFREEFPDSFAGWVGER